MNAVAVKNLTKVFRNTQTEAWRYLSGLQPDSHSDGGGEQHHAAAAGRQSPAQPHAFGDA